MNSKILYLGIFNLMLSVAILDNIHNTISGQPTNTTQGNTSFASTAQGNMTVQTLNAEEAALVARENSAIWNDNQENEEINYNNN